MSATRALASRWQGGLTGGAVTMLGLTAAAAGTTWVAMLAWRGFTTQSALFLGPLFMLGLLVGGLGVALRLARLPVPLIFGAQIVAAFPAALATITGSALPTSASLADLGARVRGAIESSQAYAAPVPPDVPGVEPLLILGGTACLLLVDLLACSLRRVPLAGLPLLTIYTVPVSLTVEGVSWWVFAATAAGFAAMLFLQEAEHLSRWGRTLGQEDTSGFSVRTGDVRTSAAGIAGLATAVALVLPMLIPTFSLALFSGGFGPGSGDDIRIENPVTDLRRDLQRAEDQPLLRVVTADPNPQYLRLAVLTRLGDEEWSSGNRSVPQDNLAQGPLPALEGVANDVPRREFSYQVQALDALDSLWLPTAQHLSQIQAPGNWRYDSRTMDFLAGDEGLSTAGLDYTFTKVELDVTAIDMARAPAPLGAVDAEFTALPGNLPPVVRELARQVTDGYTTRFQRAVALQSWFREDGGFTYDLTTDAGQGAGDLTSFLTEGPGGRTGYCEQFASAMAVMARTLGIPARVAVGFLRPQQIGDTRYEYSSHDMHAWPELYFPGSGWVRFEPTPAGGRTAVPTNVPDYTEESLPEFAVPSGAPSGNQATEDLPSRGSDAVTDAPSAADDADDDAFALGVVGRRVLAGLASVMLLGAALLVPRLLRHRRRQRRWEGEGGAPAAWAELHDTATDLGIPWQSGISPRATRARLVRHFGAPVSEDTPERPLRGPELAPEAVAALDRIVHQVELLRFARHPGTAGAAELRFDTELCVAALEGGATRGARRRALWWPRSVFTRARRPADPAGIGSADIEETTLASTGVVVDHVR